MSWLIYFMCTTGFALFVLEQKEGNILGKLFLITAWPAFLTYALANHLNKVDSNETSRTSSSVD